MSKVDAKVTKTGGTREERLVRAAENDVRTFEYALGKAQAAKAHADAKVAEYEAGLKEAQARLEERRQAEQAAKEKEGGG